MINKTIKDKLNLLPALPGVYFHKNQHNEIIYVGKAAVLKNRVRQYFQNSIKDQKTLNLVSEISDFDFIVTDSEIDALFLESEMIKRYQPKWNILLKDDKTVTFVRIDLKSEIPIVTTTPNPVDDNALYIGPFYGRSAISKALKSLRKVFPFYDRKYTGKRSLYTDLGLTPGIEIGVSTSQQYKQNLKKLISYLKGDKKQLIASLESEMKKASSEAKFEQALVLRNQVLGLKELSRKIIFSDQEFLDISKDRALIELQELLKLKSPPRRIEGYDISHQSGENAVASMVVFINGVSARQEYRKFKIRHSKNNDFENLKEVLERRIKHQEWPLPELILIDGGIPQLNFLAPLLNELNIPYLGLAEKNETIVLPLSTNPKTYQELTLPRSSDLLKLLQRIRDESHRFAITYHTSLKSQSLFKK